MQISIPEPCHESWAEMTPTQQGRHCKACAKTVVDFTKKSDEEVLSYLETASGQTCGRIRKDQLKRPLTSPIIGGISRWISVGLASIAAFIGSTNALAQQIQGEIMPYFLDTSRVEQPVDTVTQGRVAVNPTSDHALMNGKKPSSDDGEIEVVNLPEVVVAGYRVNAMELDITVTTGLVVLTKKDLEKIKKPALKIVTSSSIDSTASLKSIGNTSSNRVDNIERCGPEGQPKPPAALIITDSSSEEAAPSFTIFPNPSIGNATVQVPTSKEARLLNIFNATGQLVKAQVLQPFETEVEINLPSTAARGVHTIQLANSTGEILTAQQWIVQ